MNDDARPDGLSSVRALAGEAEQRRRVMRVTAAELIRAALLSMGGEAAIRDVQEWARRSHPGAVTDSTISTAMADLANPGNPSSTYRLEARFLERTGRGRYRIRP
jgi:hypothetical protein